MINYLILFHPHPTSPVKGEEYNVPPLAACDELSRVGGIEGGGKMAFTLIGIIVPIFSEGIINKKGRRYSATLCLYLQPHYSAFSIYVYPENSG